MVERFVGDGAENCHEHAVGDVAQHVEYVFLAGVVFDYLQGVAHVADVFADVLGGVEVDQILISPQRFGDIELKLVHQLLDKTL